MDEFNTLKHIINLSIIQLIEKMNIKLAANSELYVINK